MYIITPVFKDIIGKFLIIAKHEILQKNDVTLNQLFTNAEVHYEVYQKSFDDIRKIFKIGKEFLRSFENDAPGYQTLKSTLVGLTHS